MAYSGCTKQSDVRKTLKCEKKLDCGVFFVNFVN